MCTSPPNRLRISKIGDHFGQLFAFNWHALVLEIRGKNISHREPILRMIGSSQNFFQLTFVLYKDVLDVHM